MLPDPIDDKPQWVIAMQAAESIMNLQVILNMRKSYIGPGPTGKPIESSFKSFERLIKRRC